MYKKYMCLVLVVLLGMVGSAWAVVPNVNWNNGGGDRLWRNGDNWDVGVPTTADKAAIRASIAGPIIDSSTAAVALNVVCGDWGHTDSIDITGGTLTAGGWFILGYGAGDDGTFNVSGGATSVGSHLDVGREGVGHMNMTTGTVTVTSTFGIATNGGSGDVQLDGGTISCDAFSMATGATMDISNTGTLIVNDNATSIISGYISNGWLTAYSGTGTIIYDYNETNTGKTTVTASGTPPLPQKNVVFITIEDINTDVGCYGHPLVQTPYMDSLAATGMRFGNAGCNYAVCNPSRSSFLTGLRPDTTGIFDNVVPYMDNLADRVSLPQLFRNNGYYTKRLGKIFNGGGDQEDPLAWDEASSPGGTSLGQTGEGRNLTDGVLDWCRWLAANGDDEDQSDGNIAKEAVEFLNQSHSVPFFLGLGFHKPHDPFSAPASYFDLYPLEDCDPPVVPGGWEPFNCLSVPCGTMAIFDLFDDQDKREFLRARYACTTFVDAQVGKVIQALEDNQLIDDTIIILFGDHGYHHGDHRWWNKVTVFDRSHRAPFIVVAPDSEAPAGSVTNEIIEYVDIYPTLAEMCKLEDVPDDLEGISFSPLLDNPNLPWKEAGYIQVRRGSIFGRAIHTQRWRYVEWEDGLQGRELYDHQTDPEEYINLAEEPEYADEILYLQDLLYTGHNQIRSVE